MEVSLTCCDMGHVEAQGKHYQVDNNNAGGIHVQFTGSGRDMELSLNILHGMERCSMLRHRRGHS